MNVRAHVLIRGRVQGVFFRAETRYRARKYGVYGWVRNTDDGRVEAIFEGDKKNVDKMIEYCRRGPAGARVIRFDVEWEECLSEFNDFRIRYK